MLYNVVVVAAIVILMPFQFIMPAYLLFLLVCLIMMQLLMEYLNDYYVYTITGLSAMIVMMQSLSPNYGALYVAALVMLMLLLKFVVPSQYLLLMIDIIVAVIVLQFFIPSFVLMVLGIAILYALLKEEYSDYRKNAICYILYGVYISSGFVISLIMLPAALAWPMNVRNIVLGAYFSKPLSQMLGIRWEIRGDQNMPNDETAAVIVSNHQTIFDVLGMAHAIRTLNIRATGVAQRMVFWIWPFGFVLWLSGVIFVSRLPETEESTEQLLQLSQNSILNKVKIWFFPEGEFNSNPSTLKTFRKEAFKIAITHQVPIVPVVFSPYYFVSWEEKRFDMGTVAMEILPAIDTKNKTMANLDELMQITYQAMSEKNAQLISEFSK